MDHQVTGRMFNKTAEVIEDMHLSRDLTGSSRSVLRRKVAQECPHCSDCKALRVNDFVDHVHSRSIARARCVHDLTKTRVGSELRCPDGSVHKFDLEGVYRESLNARAWPLREEDVFDRWSYSRAGVAERSRWLREPTMEDVARQYMKTYEARFEKPRPPERAAEEGVQRPAPSTLGTQDRPQTIEQDVW